MMISKSSYPFAHGNCKRICKRYTTRGQNVITHMAQKICKLWQYKWGQCGCEDGFRYINWKKIIDKQETSDMVRKGNIMTYAAPDDMELYLLWVATEYVFSSKDFSFLQESVGMRLLLFFLTPICMKRRKVQLLTQTGVVF